MNTTTKIVSTKVQAYLMRDTGRKDEKGKAIEEPQLDSEGNLIPCPAQKTNLTVDWTDCSEDDIKAMALAGLIVKLQGGWRRNGIPAEITVKAADHKVGTRAPAAKAMTLDDLIEKAKTDPEYKKLLLERLAG